MLFRSNNSTEEYELMEQTARETDEELLIESDQSNVANINGSRSSSESQTSELFESIEDYNKRANETQDNFNNNGLFQEAWRQYKNPKSIGKYVVTGGMIILCLFWIVGIIVYSKGQVFQTIKDIKNHPIIEYSGNNITLNKYDPKLQNVTMEKYREGIYYPIINEINWLDEKQYPKNSAGGYYHTRNENGGIVIKSTSSDSTLILIENKQFEYLNNFFIIDDIYINPYHPIDDLQNYHIVRTNTKSQWRHSSLSLYWLYNVATLEFIPIQPSYIKQQLYKQEKLSEEMLLHKLHFAEFSPNSEFIIFGCNHDLFILDLKTFETIQLTDTGSKNIFNGKPDWVYEEEVFANDKAFWWSKNGNKLIYITLNDTLVEDFELSYTIMDNKEITSGKKRDLDFHQYPQNIRYKYPKPGSFNPELTINEYNLKEGKNYVLDINYSSFGRDFIIYDGIWVDDEHFIFKLTDRTSKLFSKQVYSTKSNEITEVSFVNVSKSYDGWIQKQSSILPLHSQLSDGSISTSYIDKVVINGYTHLALFDEPISSNYSKLLTSSDTWEVKLDSPIVYDSLENFIYVLTSERSSMDSHLIGIDLSDSAKNIVHITDINEDGKYSINFSPNGQYLSLIYDGPLQPWQKLINMQEIHDILHSDISNIDEEIKLLFSSIPFINDYDKTSKVLLNTNIPTKLYKTVTIDKYEGRPVNLNIIEILPPNFNPTKFKYPLLVHAYGGPGYQFVDKSFSINFLDIVASTLNAIVLVIDPRGTGGQGWEFSSFANNKIGFWEPRDITTVVSQYLIVNDNFMLKDRVALWGWSYGGFTTLKTLEYDSGNIFKFGMAVAPVTNWMFYDSIYTERYMGLPKSNPNYKATSKINDFENFKKVNRFLLMHGTSDDNVHLQNTLWLLDNFNLQTVENYDLHIFPDSDHSIMYHNANSIVYDKLINWLDHAFSGKFDNLI